MKWKSDFNYRIPSYSQTILINIIIMRIKEEIMEILYFPSLFVQYNN